ncbi:MAG: PEP-CTERM sorting domain-containing protein [Planctomycetia bacterium]|nr:PEP-CTERM sorting domain-containing protein [Planctomycetia bacterium]
MRLMNRFVSVSCWGALSVAVLLGSVGVNRVEARGTSTYSGTSERPSSSDGGAWLNGNDIRIEADTNCAWVYHSAEHTTPAFWSNNFFITGTGFGSEKGGALRFGQGGYTFSTPMIVTGDVTLIGDATIGVNTSTIDAVGMITGQLKTENSEYELLIRSKSTSYSAGDREKPGILVLTADSADFTSDIHVGGGTLQLGSISNFTATGHEWVPTADGTGETYQKNSAKNFVFDGSTGSVGSANINVTSLGGYDSILKFQRSGNVAINNNITGTGKVVLDGTATYSMGENGAIANTLASVTINEGATFVNNRNSKGNDNAGDYAWDYTGPSVSGSGFYQVGYATKADITASNYRCTLYGTDSVPGVASDFTGVYVFSDGYRLNLSSAWNAEEKGYNLGVTDDGQIWMTGNGTYTGDLYLKGEGWSTSEYRGALRFAGGEGDTSDLATRTTMNATYGNIYLMGDTRISAHANQATVALIESNISNYNGGDYYVEFNARGGLASRIILTGTNTHGKTYVKGGDTLQIGHQGTINGKEYDGTTGTLGVGAVDVEGNATIHFKRSNDYALGEGNVITNNGTLIFDGGGNYTLNATITNAKNITVTEGTKLLMGKGFSGNGTLSGAGTVQINHANGDSANYSGFPIPSLTEFTGTLIAGEGYRWQSASLPGVASVGAADGGQLWLTSATDFNNEVYLSGNGWHKNERFGALRFASATSTTDMANITKDVHLMGDTRISARNGNSPGSGMISGNIDGDYTLSVNGGGSGGTIILTGTNTYGATVLESTETLVVGWIGTVNGRQFDGTSGTLGTGVATVGEGATLKFMRSGDVKIANALNGTGTVVFDGTANYAIDVTNIASTLKSVQITQNAMVTLGGNISTDVTAGFSGDGTLGINNANFSLILGAANTSQSAIPTAALTLTNDVDLGTENILSWTYAEGANITTDDTLYLLAGTTDTLGNFDLNSLTINAPALASDYFWTLDTIAYGNGLVITAKMGVPEPATWVLLISGIIGLGVVARRKKH